MPAGTGKLAKGVIVKGSSLPEPVRVLSFSPVNEQIYRLIGIGLDSQQTYNLLLTAEEVEQLTTISQGWSFSGDAEAVFLAVEAIRIRNAHLFDPFCAVHAAQIEPLPHQLDAVYRFILPQTRIRFLLADDPGAGKTIMAGLVLKELKMRGLVKRTLIIVPGHLQDQWQREMKEKFGEHFIRVDRGVINAHWGRNVWRYHSQVITSIDFAKQEDVLDTLKDANWDLVVVDEAHKLSAYRYGENIRKTERYKLGEVVSGRTNSLLFLTATPHRGDPENFRLLLDLLEPHFFSSKELLEEAVINGDNPLFLRRLKEELKDFDGHPLFPPRHVHTVKYRLSERERQLYNAVTKYVQEHMDKALKSNRRNVAFAMLVLQRRLASSVHALRDSLERRRYRLKSLLQLGQWLKEQEVGEIDFEEIEDAPEVERLKREQELVEKLTNAQTQRELEEEIAQLEQLVRMAKDLERAEEETKLLELRMVVENERLRETGEKLLIFTESVKTMEYLAEKLRSWGFSVTTLHGGMNLSERIRAEHEFRDKTQVMVSTEAGGEGINLQFCSLMVNYDIPWSFTRLEQRMGRIHRYGQINEVHIYNLVTEDTIEGKVLARVMERLEMARQELGKDRVYDVIGEIFHDRRLEELILEALSQRKTLDEIVAEIEALPDEELIERIRQALGDALATRHIDITRLKELETEAAEHRLIPEYIEAFFERACKFLGLNAQRRRDQTKLWRIESVPHYLRKPSEDFQSKFGEVQDSYLRLAFDKKTAKELNADFVAPGHPLLEAIIEVVLQRGEDEMSKGAAFYSPTGKEGLLWFLEGEIRDGNFQLAGKKLIAMWQDQSGNFYPTDPSILWDLLPASSENIESRSVSDDEVDKAIACAFAEVLEPYKRQILKERQRQAEIKRKYGVRSLECELADSEAKIADYEARQLKGEDMRIALLNEKMKRDEIAKRLKELKEQIAKETQLGVCEPKILTVIRVLPMTSDEDWSDESDPEIEAIGMKVAIEHEKAQGRIPEDVSMRKCGYDIRSLNPEGQVERYIEVKARAKTGAIALTPNEWLMAQRLGEKYWLYIITDAKTPSPQLFVIQNPAQNLNPQAKIVRFVVTDWKEAATPVKLED
ncbi:MAG: helicase-related protein [Armatimonadetes bacterium]|nr:helicase-related protein [Armatimonadota bacterium]